MIKKIVKKNKNIGARLQGIYAITPNQVLHLDIAGQIISDSQINILQYRRKIPDALIKLGEAKQLQQLCLRHDTLFIINDDINLAEKVGADGVHLGKNDNTIGYARKQLGDDAVIGMSCYDDINLAKQAQNLGADYVAFGALFPSSTKPNTVLCSLDTIIQAKQVLNIPIVGIGGINFFNQQFAFNAGCDAVAMISALWKSPTQSADSLQDNTTHT